MPSAEPPVLAPCPLHQSRLVIHPISRSGSEFSTNFLHLVRQSALLNSHVVKSGVTGPPRRQRCASGFSRRIVHASTNPISVSVELSLLLLLPLLSADSGTVRCSLHLFRSPCSTGASVTSGGESTAWVLLRKPPLMTNWRESLSCSPIQLFSAPHLIRERGRWLCSGKKIWGVSHT